MILTTDTMPGNDNTVYVSFKAGIHFIIIIIIIIFIIMYE
jgi:hypothetical protein